MTQTAQVKRILSERLAEVSVTRQGACGHNCAECGGCSTAVMPTVTAVADNHVGAKAGDLVLVETASGKILGTAALVYLVPMALLILGYLVGAGLGFTSGYCILMGTAFFLLGIGGVLLLDRYVKRHSTFQFHIVSVKSL